MQFLEVCSCFSVYNDANLTSSRDVISNRLFTEHNTTQSQTDFMQIAEEVAPVNKDLSDRWGSVYSATEIHCVNVGPLLSSEKPTCRAMRKYPN